MSCESSPEQPCSLHDIEIQEYGITENKKMGYTRRKIGDIDHKISVELPKKVEVVFRNLESRLISLILESEVVFGCVAWLTNQKVLEALGQKQVHIAIQKEDFIRPDSSGWSKGKLQRLYGNLKPYFHKKVTKINHWGWDDVTDYQNLFKGMDVELKYLHRINNHGDECDAYLDPIRCVGGFNKDRKSAFPRMHNKFFIFFDKSLKPRTVWTGSFNPTQNSSNSLENAVIIKDEEIARAYFQEFELIWVMSEPLDWCSDWCNPEYALGEGIDALEFREQFVDIYIGSGSGIPITYNQKALNCED